MRRVAPLLLAFACAPGAPERVRSSEAVAGTGEERTEQSAEPAGVDRSVPVAGNQREPQERRVCPAPGVHDLPDAGGYPGAARLVWTGTHYLQLWYERERDGRDFRLFVMRLDTDLEPLDAPRRLFPSTPEHTSRSGVQVALGDRVVGLVYKHSRTEMRSPPPRRGPPDGIPPRPTPFEAQTGPQPTLVAIEARFLRLDLDGEPIGDERPVAPNAAPWNGDHAAIAWDAAHRRWGVTFEGSEPRGANRRPYFVQLDESGEPTSEPIVLSDSPSAMGSAAQSVVARPGGGFAVVWGDRHPKLAEIGDGVRRMTLAQVAGGGEASLVTDGRRYAVAFIAGTPRAVHLASAEVGGDPRPDLAQAVGAAGRYSGSADLRFGARGLELVYVQQDARRRSRIHRRVLTPNGLLEATALTDDSNGDHGWPVFVEGDGPCPGLFSYLAFGGGDASLRAFGPERRP